MHLFFNLKVNMTYTSSYYYYTLIYPSKMSFKLTDFENLTASFRRIGVTNSTGVDVWLHALQTNVSLDFLEFLFNAKNGQTDLLDTLRSNTLENEGIQYNTLTWIVRKFIGTDNYEKALVYLCRYSKIQLFIAKEPEFFKAFNSKKYLKVMAATHGLSESECMNVFSMTLGRGFDPQKDLLTENLVTAVQEYNIGAINCLCRNGAGLSPAVIFAFRQVADHQKRMEIVETLCKHSRLTVGSGIGYILQVPAPDFEVIKRMIKTITSASVLLESLEQIVEPNCLRKFGSFMPYEFFQEILTTHKIKILIQTAEPTVKIGILKTISLALNEHIEKFMDLFI